MRGAEMRRRNGIATAALMGAVFLVMLVLNDLTPYVADDYNYLIHFGTKEPIRSLKDVAESMYIHCLKMNGRVVSHTIAQLFSMAPKGIYNLCNAAVYAASMYLMYRIANFGQRRDPMLLTLICMVFFCAMPVFGQVCLWYVGAVNYLWALLGGLMFVMPFLMRYLELPDLMCGWRFPLFCVGCLLFGMYSEITSFVCIYLAFALMVIPAVLNRKSLKTKLWIGWLLACCGYLILLSIPAERNAKQAGGLTFALLLSNFDRATQMLLTNCRWLLVIFGALFILGLVKRIDRRRLILAALLLTGALGGNYMTMVASYYPARCLATTAMLLILANAMLLAPWLKTTAVKAAGIVLAAVFLWQGWFGVRDIYRCREDFNAREAVIVAAAEAGDQLVTAEIVVPKTPYSAFWELRDLSADDPTTWPNFAMGKIYGIEILGILPE